MGISVLFDSARARFGGSAGRWLMLGLAAAGSGAAHAQVTGIVTSSQVTARLQPGPKAGDTGVSTFNGPQVQGSVGSNTLGSGGTYASTARVDSDGIDFQNGNAAAGRYAYMSSHTAIDISFINDGSKAVTPSLHSLILPSGLGLFIDNPCLDDVSGCSLDHSVPGVRDFNSFTPDTLPVASNQIAGASFDFRVMSGSTMVYDLSGSVVLAFDPTTGKNILITDLGAAAAALTGFRLTSLPGDPGQFGVVWDATDLDVAFPSGTLLQPGEGATLTYESTVETFSRTSCVAINLRECVVAYSSFGDPVGRGGGIHPTLAARDSLAGSGGLTFDTYQFAHPVFHDGVLSFGLTSDVVEPSSWMMMIAGFGLAGLALRRRPSRAELVA